MDGASHTTFTPSDPAGAPPQPAPPLPAPGHAFAPPQVWAAVQADYRAGLSGPACARRHGVGLSTLRERAAREGWRRLDQPWTPPAPLDPDDPGLSLEEWYDGDLVRIPLEELGAVADERMVRAVLRGDAPGAMRWRRVRDAMAHDAREAAWRASERVHAERERAAAAARAAAPS